MIYLQYSALHRIYHRVPELSKAPLSTSPAAAPAGMHRNNHASGCPTWLRALRDFAGHLQVYARQRSFLPGMALAMLYCTVLSFHMTMIAYLMVRVSHTVPFCAPSPTPPQIAAHRSIVHAKFTNTLQPSISPHPDAGPPRRVHRPSPGPVVSHWHPRHALLRVAQRAHGHGACYVRACVCTHNSQSHPSYDVHRHHHHHRPAPASWRCGAKSPS